MYAETRLRRWPLNAVIATTWIGLSAVAPLAAVADPPSASAPHTLESKVSLADLDLSTAQGLRAAQKRLKAKADHLCRQLQDSVSATFRWTYAACVNETLANAMQRLNVEALAAADGPRTDP